MTGTDIDAAQQGGTPGAGVAAARQRRRALPSAVMVSLLAHGLLLSLTFAGGGLGRAWQERSAQAPELRVVLQPEAPAAGSAPQEAQAAVVTQARVEADMPAPAPPIDTAPAPPVLTAERSLAAWAVPAASAATVAALAAVPAPRIERLSRPTDGPRARSDRDAAERSAELARVDTARQALPSAPAVLAAGSPPAIEALQRAAGTARLSESRERSTALAQLDLARGELRAAPALLSAAASPALESLRRPIDLQRPRQPEGLDRNGELARVDAQQGIARIEAVRNETLRHEAALADAARLEAVRAEAAERAAHQATQQAAARQEAARLEGIRQEGLRLEAARLAAVQAQAQAEEAQREARKRAIGRQLDEEAARRDAQREAERQRPDWAPARRGRLFGRTDANAELAAYGEAWARKISNNLSQEQLRELTRQPAGDAVITVAVRSNGSVESITVVRSSGVPAVDEAIQRIVRSQENYPAFSAALLRDFDVIEIRRSWHVDSALRLY